ncbi:uncharacterized protein LOC143840384 isoform X5 [Paroedura picta]|uniref:uncharacterized protein LOC143840384 isoform X5 n=1 Tax=Paroedura picta TaxID=143630 RepID=UPI004055B412
MRSEEARATENYFSLEINALFGLQRKSQDSFVFLLKRCSWLEDKPPPPPTPSDSRDPASPPPPQTPEGLRGDLADTRPN